MVDTPPVCVFLYQRNTPESPTVGDRVALWAM